MKRTILFLAIFLFFQTENIFAGVLESSPVAEEGKGNQNFKDIVVSKKNGQYIITGKSKVKKGVFYYSVEDGHRVLIPETKVRINNLYWTSFKLSITVPEQFAPESGVLMLNLYEKGRSKEIRDHFPVILDHSMKKQS